MVTLLTALAMLLPSSAATPTVRSGPLAPGAGGHGSAWAAEGGVPVWRAAVSYHDLTVVGSNTTTLAGDAVTFTATVSATITSYQWVWGDGSTTTTTSSPTTHVYAYPGLYYVYVNATDTSGNYHDNLRSLLHLPVLNSFVPDALGNLAQAGGTVVANSTSSSGAQAVIQPGGLIIVSNWVITRPTDPLWSVQTPSYLLGPPATLYASTSSSVISTTGLSGVTVSFSPSTPGGSYVLNFSVPTEATVPTTGWAWTNFSFTIFVAPLAAPSPVGVPTSPHAGTLIVDTTDGPLGQVWGGVTGSLDPAVAYSSVSTAVNQEVYQTLIAYNGSHAGPDPQDFVPDLATCVPGSAQCGSLYGSSLASPPYYTFVLDPNATFYNGSTGAHWSVHPNDVAFSLARLCAFSTWQGNLGITPGWILCQSLLPGSRSTVNPPNQGWDNGWHFPFNSTPGNILSAITVNDSRFCTSAMMDGVHGAGCVTLDTTLSSQGWPEFLEFLANGYGTLIYSCAFATELGAGLPGWESGTSCLPAPPGQSGNPNPVPGPTAWDNAVEWHLGPPFTPWGSNPLQWQALGSGPYWLSSLSVNASYELTANPFWGGTHCMGGLRDGCLPPATPSGGTPSYVPKVVVSFESNPGPGLQALAAGQADLVDTWASNSSQVVDLLQSGHMGAAELPTANIFFSTFDMNYVPSKAAWYTGWTPTLPATAFQDLNLRQFIVHAYPHLSNQVQGCAPAGLAYCFQYGGALPTFLDPYTPTNISWDLTDPNSNSSQVGSAAWWWQQVASDGLVGPVCKASSPCTFPLFTTNDSTGRTLLVLRAWANEIKTLSGGAITPTVVEVGINQLFGGMLSVPPGQSPAPFFVFGWLPDYFDPSDYILPQVLPDSTYTWSNSVNESLSAYSASCSGTYFSPIVSQGCQGSAYSAEVNLARQGGACMPPSCSSSQRALDYNMVEQIDQQLALRTTVDQQEQLLVFAPWIDESTLGLNPMSNGFGTIDGEPFYQLRYLSDIPPGYSIQLTQVTNPGSGGSLTVETGTHLLLLVGVAGGTGIYHFIWKNLPGGCSSADTPALWCRPTAAGSFNVNVLVTDSAGDAAVNAPVALTVVSAPTVTSFAATPAAITLGQSTSFSVVAQGGIGGLTLAYTGLPPGCASQNATTLPCTPTDAGSYSVGVSAVDAMGLTAVATTVLLVSPVATVSLSNVVLSPSSASVAAGGTASFSLRAIGSNGAPLYQGVAEVWRVVPATAGSLNTSTGTLVLFTAGSLAGTAVLEANVSFGGLSLVSLATITIAGSSPPPPTNGSPGEHGGPVYTQSQVLLYAAVDAILGVTLGFLIAALVLLRGRGVPPSRRAPDPESVADPGPDPPKEGPAAGEALDPSQP